MGGGLACGYEEIHIISTCEAASTQTYAVHTASLGRKWTDAVGTVSVSPWGWDWGKSWQGVRTENEDWGTETAAYYCHSQTSCGHLIKQTSLCSSCWDDAFIPHQTIAYIISHTVDVTGCSSILYRMHDFTLLLWDAVTIVRYLWLISLFGGKNVI